VAKGYEKLQVSFLLRSRDGATKMTRILKLTLKFKSVRECLSALQANSPDAHVFCLLHKMDLVEASRRRSVYASRVEELRKKSQGSTIHCFATSIMDETIYKVSIEHAYSIQTSELIKGTSPTRLGQRLFTP